MTTTAGLREPVGTPVPDAESCYRAVSSRDRRFDGVFWTAVHTTGIYCRPSCPARTPHRRNVSFHATAASAQAAGFRACRRCLPDAAPDSPHWDVAADVAGRAMRLVADGVVDREGVEGLSSRLGYSTRHLNRLLVSELGAGPLALARARRAQNARVLLETTDWRLADVAFAAGFASVRQFNDTVREVYACTPSELRLRRPAAHGAAGASASPSEGAARGAAVVTLDVRLAVRLPFDADRLATFLALHLVPGVEDAGPGWYARSLRLPHGVGVVRLDLHGADRSGVVGCRLALTDVRDVGPATERCRRLVDAGCDPQAVAAALGAHPVLARSVAQRPGLRAPGHVDGPEVALRTVLGQQVSLKAANRLGGVLVAHAGEAVPPALAHGGVTALFPEPEAVAAVPDEALPMPASRRATLRGLARALADGDVALDRSADRAEVRRRLLALRGVGPWTADYVLMRALGDPDVFLPGDVAVRGVLAEHGVDAGDPAALAAFAAEVAPWRSYAVMHLWADRLDRVALPWDPATPRRPRAARRTPAAVPTAGPARTATPESREDLP